jgi:hypothetical protein
LGGENLRGGEILAAIILCGDILVDGEVLLF